MSRWDGLRVGLAMASIALSGCSAIMAASTPRPKDMNVLLVGTPRSEVLKEFGEPEQTGVHDRKRVDTFRFKQGEQDNQKLGRAALHAGMDLITFGIWEIVGTPLEIMSIQPETTVDVTYDEWDRVEFVGPAGIHWAKAGATKEDFQRDTYECRQASKPSAPSVVAGPLAPLPLQLVGRAEYQAENLYRDCMRARGYELNRRQLEERGDPGTQPERTRPLDTSQGQPRRDPVHQTAGGQVSSESRLPATTR